MYKILKIPQKNVKTNKLIKIQTQKKSQLCFCTITMSDQKRNKTILFIIVSKRVKSLGIN